MSKLNQCPLFKGMSPEEINHLLGGRYDVKTYRTGELIALQSSLYDQLLIVTEGSVRGEMTDELGRSTLIEVIQAPRTIAPAFLYASENKLPVAIIAGETTEITAIRRSQFTSMMQQDARLLTNYLNSMADRSRFLSEKLRMQRFGTIKSKLAKYLLEQSQRQSKTEFTIPHTQQELADLFGVTRPALARVLKHMEDEQLILAKSKHFSLLNKKGLLDC